MSKFAKLISRNTIGVHNMSIQKFWRDEQDLVVMLLYHLQFCLKKKKNIVDGLCFIFSSFEENWNIYPKIGMICLKVDMFLVWNTQISIRFFNDFPKSKKKKIHKK